MPREAFEGQEAQMDTIQDLIMIEDAFLRDAVAEAIGTDNEGDVAALQLGMITNSRKAAEQAANQFESQQ